MGFIDLKDSPHRVEAETEAGPARLERYGERWSNREVEVAVRSGAVEISAPAARLRRVHLRWRADLRPGVRLLGDAWERAYGDLEWRGLVPERPMPWYFFCLEGGATHGYGVRTSPSALCHWRADPRGISLWLDVRSGGRGVNLGNRTLRAAEVVSRPGAEAESPFLAAREFCSDLCREPRLPADPVHGGNTWYFTYGKGLTAEIVLQSSRRLAEFGQGLFMVVDAGWQPRSECHGAPWDRGNERCGDMARLASRMRETGVRPGIWIRPLEALGDAPESLFLPPHDESPRGVLDPARPGTLERVAADMARLRDWGYDLIKHDFTTFDVLGRWGFSMGAEVTSDGWTLGDGTRTTAEVLSDLYRAIRHAAGDALLIGCNTMGHLGAGLFELQRTGDDTSGLEWERTRRMGINALAFRMPQHNTFFFSDADCVGLTDRVPRALNRRWMELLARSGTPLFVSSDFQEPVDAEVRRAFATALAGPPPAEPLDWLDTTCPTRWRFGSETVEFDWTPE
jgi:alpha-galactosidase